MRSSRIVRPAALAALAAASTPAHAGLVTFTGDSRAFSIGAAVDDSFEQRTANNVSFGRIDADLTTGRVTDPDRPGYAEASGSILSFYRRSQIIWSGDIGVSYDTAGAGVFGPDLFADGQHGGSMTMRVNREAQVRLEGFIEFTGDPEAFQFGASLPLFAHGDFTPIVDVAFFSAGEPGHTTQRIDFTGADALTATVTPGDYLWEPNIQLGTFTGPSGDASIAFHLALTFIPAPGSALTLAAAAPWAIRRRR